MSDALMTAPAAGSDVSLLDKWQLLQDLIRDPKVTPLATDVAAVLLNRIDRRTGVVLPTTLDEIADLLGGQRKRTAIIEAIKCLIAAGRLHQRRRQGPPVYTFVFGPIEVRNSEPQEAPEEVRKPEPQTPPEVRNSERLLPHIDASEVRNSRPREVRKTGPQNGFEIRNSGPPIRKKPGFKKPGKRPEERERKRAHPPNRARQLPADWSPSDSEVDFALGEGLTVPEVDREAAKFRDHWRSKGESRRDWSASWRNWVRKGIEFRRPTNTTGAGAPGRNSSAPILDALLNPYGITRTP